MKHGSLFSGIGGFDLAAQWMGWENVFQVEIDPWCRRVLQKNFPDTDRHADIKEFKGTRGSVDILSGGFPCQPFSHAGKRKGESDDRYLWPEYLRVIREIQPTYVVGENVAGLLSMEDGKTLEWIFSDLEGEGYTVESFIIPSGGVGAWHIRQRVWVVAYAMCGTDSSDRGEAGKVQRISGEHRAGGYTREFDRTNSTFYTNPNSHGLQRNVTKPQAHGDINGLFEAERRFYDTPESRICRTADGIPNRVDRIKGLGNAIVPQVAYEIFKAIASI